MKSKFLLISALLLATCLFSSCSRTYSQDELDAIKESYESELAEAENTISSLQDTEAQSEITSDNSNNDVITIHRPSDMSDDIFSYAKYTFGICNKYLNNELTHAECEKLFKQIKISDFILSNRSKLNPTDSSASDLIIACYSKFSKSEDDEESYGELQEYFDALSLLLCAE